MNFKVSKSEFLKSLNLVARAISNNTPLPSLSGIKIIVENDEVVLIASDSNISIKTRLTKEKEKNLLTINEEGAIVIDARYILEISRKIDGDTISFEIIDGTLTMIKGTKSEFKINGMRASDYPEINFAIGGKPFFVETKVFNDVVEQTSFACSEKETRPALTGVNLILKNKKLHASATDSYRLATKTIDIDSEMDFNITIPSKHLNEVYRSVAAEEKIEIAIDHQKIAFLFEDTIIQTRLIDDAYPDTSRLIPTSFTQTLEVNARDLLSAIDRSSFIKSDGKNVVKLSIDSENITVTSSNQEIGSSFEVIPVIAFEGNPLSISCSGKYLMDAVKVLRSETVLLKFSGELKPIIIQTKEDENIVQLISPVRTYN